MKNCGVKIFAPFQTFFNWQEESKNRRPSWNICLWWFWDFCKKLGKGIVNFTNLFALFLSSQSHLNTTLGCNYMFQVQWVDFSYLTIYYTLNNSFAPTDVIHLLKMYEPEYLHLQKVHNEAIFFSPFKFCVKFLKLQRVEKTWRVALYNLSIRTLG